MNAKNKKNVIELNIKHNPDVLTCLANLSNDEVFTPPNLANDILDLIPQEMFKNPNTKFLDPACKSGIFLREIARRLLIGLEDSIPDISKRRNHIFTKQIFGIAITDLTAQMSRRSLYCSKTANGKYSVAEGFVNDSGNIEFMPIKHTFKNGICVFCNASQKEYDRIEELENHAYKFIHLTDLQKEKIENMKFDVIIGNPPYQLSDGGAQASATPLYHKFVQQAKKLRPRYLAMIIPSRWFAGGKGLDEFRNEMLNDKNIRVMHDFLDAGECFPGVDIKGGVCYFLWDRDNQGSCKVITHEKENKTSTADRYLLEEDYDIFIRYNKAIPILRKIRSKNELPFNALISTRKPFGLATDFKEYNKTGSGFIIYANKDKGFLPKSFMIPKNGEWVDKWKLFVPEAIGKGDIKTDWIKPIISGPSSLCTETYLLFGPCDSKIECENIKSFIQTKFFHFLLSLKKITQHTTKNVYSFVPMQDFSKSWNDGDLYKKYKLTEDEIDFIETMVCPNINFWKDNNEK